MSTEVMIQIFESDFTDDGLVQTVNARDLHEALGVGWKFADWIKDALQDFKENQDYVIFSVKTEKMGKGRPRQDYALTLDCAKHICMMSRCEKGKQLRQYFIEAEKQFRLGLDQQQPQVGYTQQPQQQTQSQVPVYTQQTQELIPGTPEHFAHTFTLAYQQFFCGVQQAAQQPVIEHNIEPVVPRWGAGAIKAEPLPPPEPQYYNPCPSHKVTMKDLMEYMSNKRLIEYLMKKFNIHGEVHDYGYVKGQKVKPVIIYNKQQMLAILHAAYALSKPYPHNNKQRVFADILFTMKQVIKPELYDSEAFDNAYDNLKEELNHN